MGLFDSFFKGKINLTENNRELIYKLFGNFGVNRLGSSDKALLEEGYEGNTDVYSVIKKRYQIISEDLPMKSHILFLLRILNQ